MRPRQQLLVAKGAIATVGISQFSLNQIIATASFIFALLRLVYAFPKVPCTPILVLVTAVLPSRERALSEKSRPLASKPCMDKFICKPFLCEEANIFH